MKLLLVATLVLAVSFHMLCRADPPTTSEGPILEPFEEPGQLHDLTPVAAHSTEKDPPPSARDKSASSESISVPAPTPAVLPPPAKTYPIDLCTALRLAEADNPTIGIAREAIREAVAEQLRADVLLLPNLRVGANYHNHNGVLQSSFGEMRQVDEAALYAGGGARALAAETVGFPMVQVFSPLANAFLEPLVARRLVSVRSGLSDATANQVLLEVARRFLELVSAEADLEALRKSEADLEELARLTASFARAGQGREADAYRARSQYLLLQTDVQGAEERVALASANLAELLNLDPAVQLQSPAQAIGLLQLVGPTGDLASLVHQAQAARPELFASSAEIARRDAQVKQEKVRPWLPTIAVGYSNGTFGGGTNRVDLVPVSPSFGRFSNRSDLDLMAYWTFENLGLGNLAHQKERVAQREEAVAENTRLLNQVRREVVAAFSQTTAARRRYDIAQRQLRTAEDGYCADLQRIRGGQGLPIEVLNSANRLVSARRNLIQAILEFNVSQFELFVALGTRPTTACPPCDAPPLAGGQRAPAEK
jgi:outer membrane protein TolC